jgi:DNA gyrase subunit A
MDGSQADKIVEIFIEEEMRTSYINYAMSVIVARALPDVRDGLKPVHRRILYAMNELNLDPAKAYKKSARIVGDTMGKYHPHGDSSIYDAMVRMAQDFSIRYPLVDGHGNFGSMDGDSPAAQRYTEARLSRIAMEMLADIEKETVDFIPNYDGEFKEPSVLPSKFPNLLVNGSTGIAVGMATNIPPHNLTECIDALTLMLNNLIEGKSTDLRQIIEIIKGPDFPTGASILGSSGIKQAYRTGRGKITVRAQAEIVPMPGAAGREMIVVTELPYQVNKAKMIAKIADLVKDKAIDGITDVRDESDRNGVRVVIELRKDANANVILNKLYKFSSLQESFGIIMLALVNQEAVVLNLQQILEHYIWHQKDVIARRTRFELAKARKRRLILEGYLIALAHLDEVLAIIRSSQDAPEARQKLVDRFDLVEEQANAIVEMRLRALTNLESGKINDEHAQLQLDIARLTAILEHEEKLYEVIRDELAIMKAKYGDARRTRIIPDPGEIDYEDLISEESSVITMSNLDYVKRIPLNAYKSQNRGGKGVIGMQTREEDFVKDIFVCGSHDTVMFFTNMGRVYRLKAYQIPAAGRTAKGLAIVNLLKLMPGENIAAVIPASKTEERAFVLMVTKRGIVKKVSLAAFRNISQKGVMAVNIKEGDELRSVLMTGCGEDIFIATSLGMGIRFNEAQVRPMGKAATGIHGIRLKENDFVIGACVVTEGSRILFVSEKGFGKCTKLESFKLQGRRGVGLHAYKVIPRSGPVVAVCTVTDKDELMLINSEGVVIRIRVADVSTCGRTATGVKLINLNAGETVASVAKIAEDQLESESADDQDQDVPALQGEALDSEASVADDASNGEDALQAQADLDFPDLTDMEDDSFAEDEDSGLADENEDSDGIFLDDELDDGEDL